MIMSVTLCFIIKTNIISSHMNMSKYLLQYCIHVFSLKLLRSVCFLSMLATILGKQVNIDKPMLTNIHLGDYSWQRMKVHRVATRKKKYLVNMRPV